MEQFLILWVLILTAFVINSHGRIKQLEKLLKNSQTADIESKTQPKAGETTAPLPSPPQNTDKQPWAAPQKPTPSSNPEHAGAPKTSKPSALDGLFAWMSENWMYVAGATLLALSGIFLVIYGIEAGVITPTMRVLFAIIMGAALVASGEKLRKSKNAQRHGLLPAVLASAGLVVLYASVIGAEVMYNLISSPVTFVGLVGVSGLALALGGRHSIFLTLFGLTGAALSPFIMTDTPPAPFFMPIYYTLTLCVSFTLAWYKQKPLVGAWMFLLTLILTPLPIYWTAQENGAIEISAYYQGFLLLASAFFLLTHPKIEQRILPQMSGPKSIFKTNRWSAALSVLFVLGTQALFFLVLEDNNAGDIGLYMLVGFSGLFSLQSLRTRKAQDMLWLIFLVPAWGALYGFHENAISIQTTLFTLLGLTLVGALHSLQTQPEHPSDGFVAGLFPVASALILQTSLLDDHSAITPYQWALVLCAGAGVMTLASGWAAQRRRTLNLGFFAISTLALLAHAFTALMDGAALTAALSGLLVAAAYIDGRFKLPYVRAALSLGIGALVSRLLLYPGIETHLDASWPILFVSFFTALGATGLLALTGQSRAMVRACATAATGVLAPAFFTLVLVRVAQDNLILSTQAHWIWALGALSLILSGLSLTQSERPNRFDAIKHFTGLAVGGLGGVMLLGSTLFHHPAFDNEAHVVGLPILNTLLIAYLLPALTLAGLGLFYPKVKALHTKAPKALLMVAAGYSVLWLFTAARHLWHPENFNMPVIYDGEHITYTLLLLALGITTTFGSLKLNKDVRNITRRIGLAIVGCAILKAFFVDASDLDGLARVLSFLVMGLVLSGMAWLDKQMSREKPEA